MRDDHMGLKRLFIKVHGIVQGVGFRPFVYNLAESLNLNGWVNNNSEGVYIDIQGEDSSIKKFMCLLVQKNPPLSKIEKVETSEKPLCSFTDFEIAASEVKPQSITLISPDMSICSECLNDIHDKKNRRYRYPFTNCTNCGPRFSIIKSIPYDRDKTTMKKFKMCSTCQTEYENPRERRFHAEPNACPECGPSLYIKDSNLNLIKPQDEINFTIEKLKEGYIFAIKGLGGFHLVCDASNFNSVDILRKRKNRPDKPLAVMAKDTKTIEKYCFVNQEEKKCLEGTVKPIVLLKKKKVCSLPENIAPNQNTIGFMLAYTPLHSLLFENGIEILIMTSANISGLPLEYINESAEKKLSNIVDYFLFHNRDIYIPIDDSVVKFTGSKLNIIRRARGYVPQPFKLQNMKNPILACGSNMKNTFAICKDNFVFVSQHNGDLENVETTNNYKRNIKHFENIFSFTPKYAACDMHPDYTSTKYAESLNLPIIKVQHHHAHIVSCMAENNLNEDILGICFDGTGFGTDGCIWGGEFLISNLASFKRVGHIRYVKMPGSSKAVIEPLRMGISYLYETLKSNNIKHDDILNEILKVYPEYKKSYIKNIVLLIEKEINSPSTSSMGRFFDAVSSILGIRQSITYEGQASIELENCLLHSDKSYNFNIDLINNEYIINTLPIIYGILKDLKRSEKKGLISAKFHNSIVDFSVSLSKIIRKETNINKIALSGGVFQNEYLISNLILKLKKEGFEVFTQNLFPVNDGGLSLGQIISADAKLKLDT